MPASQPCDPAPAVSEAARRNCSSQPLAPLAGSLATTVDVQNPLRSAGDPPPSCLFDDRVQHARTCTPCIQRVSQADRQTPPAAPTQLQGTPREEPGAGTASRRRQSSHAEAASSQLPRSHAEEALDELDAELLRMLAEADLIVARRSAVEAPDPHRSGAVRSAVGACKSVPETPLGAAGVAASDSGLSRSPPQSSAVAPPPVHPAGVTAGPPLPAAAASQSSDTQVQAADTACQEGAADVPPAGAVDSSKAAPGEVRNTAGRAAAAAAEPAACSTANVAGDASGVFAGCSDEDEDDVDWEAVIAAPPAGPCDAALIAARVGMHRHSSGDPVAEPPAGPDALPACVPAADNAAAAAHATRCADCFLRRTYCTPGKSMCHELKQSCRHLPSGWRRWQNDHDVIAHVQICLHDRRSRPEVLTLPRRTELPLAGDRRNVHHVVLEIACTSGTKTLRLLNEYTVSLAAALRHHRPPML